MRKGLIAVALVMAAGGSAAADGLPRFGLMADVGVPDGGTASIMVRPAWPLRFHAGVSHNVVSYGYRAGVTLSPLPWAVSPTFTVDYGHYFEGDANSVVRMFSGDEEFSSPLLERVGYDYGNAHLGLEFGRERFTFYIHGGVSLIRTQVHGIDEQLGESDDGTTTITLTKDPEVDLITVSARLGFIFYVL